VLRTMSKNPFHQAILITVGFALIFLAILAPGIYSIDGNAMLAVSESLVTHRGFTVPETLGSPGVGGRIYSHWYPLLSVLAVPFAYLALELSRITHLPFHYLAALLSLPLMGVFTAGTAGLVVLLARRLGASDKGAWIAAVCLCIGTVALAYGRTFFAESLLAFLTVAAVYFTFGLSLRDILLGASFVALAILAKPTGIVIGPILAVYLLCKGVSFRRAILPLSGTGIGIGLFAVFNVIRWGHPLDFGIRSEFHLSYLLQGIPGLLVGPGYGLMWYCPPVMLAIFGFWKAMKAYRWEALAIAAVFTGFLVLHSCLPYWFGGWSWGPRYLVPTLPVLCALAGLLDGNLRKMLIVLTLVGFSINVPTTFCFYERYFAELHEQGIPLDANLAWSFRLAPWRNEWAAAIRQVRDAQESNVREIFAQRGAPGSTISESRALRVVAIWWWVLPIVHIPRVLGAAFSVLVLLCGGWMVYRSKPAETTPGDDTAHPLPQRSEFMPTNDP
jgi:hypothetical protein